VCCWRLPRSVHYGKCTPEWGRERGERVGMVRVINKRGEAEWGMGWIGRGDTQYLSGRRAHIGVLRRGQLISNYGRLLWKMQLVLGNCCAPVDAVARSAAAFGPQRAGGPSRLLFDGVRSWKMGVCLFLAHACPRLNQDEPARQQGKATAAALLLSGNSQAYVCSPSHSFSLPPSYHRRFLSPD
jgi:hypothetical protein